jgi:hypothetical protein
MKKVSYAAAAALLFLACSSGVRYSPSEIKMFSPSVQEHIRNGEIALGMDQQAVRYAWGAPNDITVLSPDASGQSREEWVYRNLGPIKTRLVFTGGKLTGVISSNPKILGGSKQEGQQQKQQQKEPAEKTGETDTRIIEDNLAK